jgi:hypothetical protein
VSSIFAMPFGLSSEKSIFLGLYEAISTETGDLGDELLQ